MWKSFTNASLTGLAGAVLESQSINQYGRKSPERGGKPKRETADRTCVMAHAPFMSKDTRQDAQEETSVHRELVGSTLTLFHTRGSPVKQCEYLEFSPNDCYSASANN